MTQIISSINHAANFIDSPVGHTIRTACSIGYSAGAGALTSVIIGSPIGAAGGAIFGVTSWVVDRSVSWISDKVLDGTNLMESTTAKTVAFILKFMITVGAGMFAATLAGFPITFTAASILGLATSVVLPAITVMVILATVAPWIISLVQWLGTHTASMQAMIDRFNPAQTDIEAGANFINNDVLANVSPETLALFAEMDPAMFQFISAKAIFIYSAGAKRNEEIPNFFQADTRESIRVLRLQLINEQTIAGVTPFITDLGPFNGEQPDNQEVRTALNRLKNIASLEIQGVSLLNRQCWQKALELVPR